MPVKPLAAATLNAAHAIGRGREVGSLEPGKQGDVVILAYPSYRFMPYHMGVNTVESVIKKGRLVFDQRQGGVIHAG